MATLGYSGLKPQWLVFYLCCVSNAGQLGTLLHLPSFKYQAKGDRSLCLAIDEIGKGGHENRVLAFKIWAQKVTTAPNFKRGREIKS